MKKMRLFGCCTCCFCTKPGFSFQHQHGVSKSSVILVTADLMPSSALFRHQTYMWCTYMHVDKNTFLQDEENTPKKN